MIAKLHPKIVAPKFLPYLLKFNRYEVYYGGRGSTKSTFIARKLILRARTDKYFRCVYSRKNGEHIRDSQFSLLKSQIRSLKLQDEFKILEGTMKIIHIPTGNEFIAKGVNDPEKVKSIDEPSHLWCEEVTEFGLEDFLTLDKSLRTPKSEISSIVSFNPVHESSWVRNHFFSESDPHLPNELFGDKITIHRSTYQDNIFIDRDAYYQTLLLSASGNRNRIRVDVEGDWGQMENKSPWLYAFEYDKHVKETIPMLPTFPVYLSFDFNREPLSCVAMQMSPQKGGKNSFVHFIDEFIADVQLKELCARIKTKYPSQILIVTGDAAGNKGDVAFEGRNQTYYTMVKSYLGLTDKMMMLNKTNLQHNDSRNICNTMLYSYPNVYFSKSGCPNLVNDLESAELDDKSSKPGMLRKDRAGFKMDLFDCFRYHIQTHFLDFVNKFFLNLNKK